MAHSSFFRLSGDFALRLPMCGGKLAAMNSRHKEITALLVIFFAVLLWSAVHPHDYFTWFLEVVPALVALAILSATYRSFQFTTLVYMFMLLHASVLMVGGHYTYAEVPIGNWFRDHFHLARNHYDRLGHFMQGFVPALVAREVLLRRQIVRRSGWLAFIVFAICMMISALYELFEYGVAAATGSAADAFLGSQGDPWDTQNDMLMCMIGSLAALVTMSRWHDRCLEKLPTRVRALHASIAGN
jgi:putative membrane protein